MATAPATPAATEETVFINIVFLSHPADISDLYLGTYVSTKFLDLPLIESIPVFMMAIKNFFKVTLDCDYTFQFFAVSQPLV